MTAVTVCRQYGYQYVRSAAAAAANYTQGYKIDGTRKSLKL